MEEDRGSGTFENSNDWNRVGIDWASVWHEVLGEVLHEVLILLNYW